MRGGGWKGEMTGSWAVGWAVVNGPASVGMTMPCDSVTGALIGVGKASSVLLVVDLTVCSLQHISK